MRLCRQPAESQIRWRFGPRSANERPQARDLRAVLERVHPIPRARVGSGAPVQTVVAPHTVLRIQEVVAAASGYRSPPSSPTMMSEPPPPSSMSLPGATEDHVVAAAPLDRVLPTTTADEIGRCRPDEGVRAGRSEQRARGLPGGQGFDRRVVRDARLARPVGVHRVDLVVAVALARERDLGAVGRPRGRLVDA